jgi:hypothetical protein
MLQIIPLSINQGSIYACSTPIPWAGLSLQPCVFDMVVYRVSPICHQVDVDGAQHTLVARGPRCTETVSSSSLVHSRLLPFFRDIVRSPAATSSRAHCRTPLLPSKFPLHRRSPKTLTIGPKIFSSPSSIMSRPAVSSPSPARFQPAGLPSKLLLHRRNPKTYTRLPYGFLPRLRW